MVRLRLLMSLFWWGYPSDNESVYYEPLGGGGQPPLAILKAALEQRGGVGLWDPGTKG